METDDPHTSDQRWSGTTKGHSPSMMQSPPPPRIELESEDTNGEPVIQDFADKYIPKEFQPERTDNVRGGPGVLSHISTLQLSDDEIAPPPPDLSRRGIHIPSRTR